MAKRARQQARRSADSNTYRFFVQPNVIRGQEVRIEDPGLVHQLGNVLRLAPGMELTLLDDSGWEYAVRIEALERHVVMGTVLDRALAPGEPRIELALHVAVIKGERFEWILQKGTELGVSVFMPILSARSIVDAAAEIGTAKIERWERIIREAAEQSRRGKLPRLQPAQLFEPACEQAGQHGPMLLLWEGSDGISLQQALREVLPAAAQSTPRSLSLFSGPEGGWTEDEIATAKRYNSLLITLGPRILRAETAPVAAVAVILYELGDLQ